jgi:hypothetical protein
MNDRTIEAILASPPEREDLVVQLFVKDGGQWGEIIQENKKLILELYQQENGQPWRLDLEEVRKALDLSCDRLKSLFDVEPERTSDDNENLHD